MENNEVFNTEIQKPARLADQVADLLRKEIDSGRLSPGETLPAESNLSKSFGVSRTVIREALGRLKYDGVIVSKQGLGAVVEGKDNRCSFRIQDESGFDPENLKQLFELRAILEGNTASLAALRRTSADIDSLRSLLQKMEEAVKSNRDGTSYDFEFHKLITNACNNNYLIDLMNFLNNKIKGVIKKARDNSSLQPGLPEIAQKEHLAIFQAVYQGDDKLAYQKMLEHLQNAGKRLGLDFTG